LAIVSNPQVNDSLLGSFSNDSFGLTANVRRSGSVFEIVVIDADSGEEVLSTHRPTRQEAEKFASGLMNPSLDPTAVLLRSGMQWS
jgi:hypothetical protein